jgi:hypothetical protein
MGEDERAMGEDERSMGAQGMCSCAISHLCGCEWACLLVHPPAQALREPIFAPAIRYWRFLEASCGASWEHSRRVHRGHQIGCIGCTCCDCVGHEVRESLTLPPAGMDGTLPLCAFDQLHRVPHGEGAQGGHIATPTGVALDEEDACVVSLQSCKVGGEEVACHAVGE